MRGRSKTARRAVRNEARTSEDSPNAPDARSPILRVGGRERDRDASSAAPVGADLPGPHPPGTHGFEVVREDERHDEDGNRSASEPRSLPVHGAPASRGLGGDHEDPHPRVERATERVLERGDPPSSPQKAPPKPANEGGPTDAIRLDPSAVGLGVVGDKSVGGHPDRHLLARAERRGEQRMMADVKMVEGAPEDRESDSGQSPEPPSGTRCSGKR